MERKRAEQIRDEVNRAAREGFSGQDLVELHSQLAGPRQSKHLDSNPIIQKPSNEALPTEKI